MIMSWPDVLDAGQVDDSSHVAFWDFLPTFAELAGAQAPGALDGISLVPGLLEGKTVGNDRPLYWEFQQKPHLELKQAARWGRWKAVRLGEQAEVELYDLEADVGETENVASQYPEWVTKFEAYLDSSGRN